MTKPAKITIHSTPPEKRVTILLNDRTMDRILDDLVVAAGGQRGMTYDGLKLARWDLRAALEKHGA